MNRQGGETGQSSRDNASMENEVDPSETNSRTILRLFSSSISRTESGLPRFHDRFSSYIVGPDPGTGPTIFPADLNGIVGTFASYNTNEPIGAAATGMNISSSVTPLPADSAAGPDVSLDLSLIPYGAQDESAEHGSSPVQVVPEINASSGAAAEHGGGGSTSMRRTTLKRSAPDDYAVGESSSAGAAQAAAGGVHKRRAAAAAAYEDENVNNLGSAACTCTTCPLHGIPAHEAAGDHGCAGTGTGNVWPIAEVQQALQNQNESLPTSSNMDLQGEAATANTTQASFVQPSMVSSIGYLPSQVPSSSFYQNSNFLSHAAETTTVPSVNTYSLTHPFENNLPNYRETSQFTPPWTNILVPRTTPSVSFPRRNYMNRGSSSWGTEATRNNNSTSTISASFMLTPRIGISTGAANLGLSNIGNNNNANLFGFPSLPSYSSSSSRAQHGGSSSSVVPAVTQLSNIARAWIQRLQVHDDYLRMTSGSDAPQRNFFTIQSPLAPGPNLNQAGSSNLSPLPPVIADGNRLRQEIRNAIQHLRNGGTIRLEELLILDYSIVLNLLDSVTEFDEPPNVENMPYEALANMGEQIGNAEVGLTSTDILTHIAREIFQSKDEESQQNDACSVCQEDYVDGEELGRLDCRHRYHLDCIKNWLVVKNTCPICKQVALTIANEEEEDEE